MRHEQREVAYLILCVFLVPGKGFDVSTVESKLRAANGWARLGSHGWLLVTERSAAQWRDELKPYVGQGSALVMRAARDWAGFKNEITDWLHKHGGQF